LTEEGQPRPSARSKWLSPARLASTGALMIVIALLVLWIAPAHGYELQLVDPAHQVGPLVHLRAKKAHRDPGTIYFVDVRERPARLLERLLPWVRSNGSSLVKTPPGISSSLEQRLSVQQMADSQKVAPYVALKLLGYKVSARSDGVTVLSVQSSAPAAKTLRPGDVILAVEGHPVTTVLGLRALLGHRHPGGVVTVRFRRGAKVDQAKLTTISDPSSPKRALIGVIGSDDLRVHLPIPVTIDSQGIGGPSAGLAFALDILQRLGRNVTHGRRIAATGELALNGEVLPIGGVKQKTLGVRRAGVDVFLVPAGDNAREARRYADGVRIIPVENIQQALRALATAAPKA
jgi:PDZ domain-containing protein